MGFDSAITKFNHERFYARSVVQSSPRRKVLSLSIVLVQKQVLKYWYLFYLVSDTSSIQIHTLDYKHFIFSGCFRSSKTLLGRPSPFSPTLQLPSWTLRRVRRLPSAELAELRIHLRRKLRVQLSRQLSQQLDSWPVEALEQLGSAPAATSASAAATAAPDPTSSSKQPGSDEPQCGWKPGSFLPEDPRLCPAVPKLV